MEQIEGKPASVVAEPPHSIDQAGLDEKGRLKLPAAYVSYLQAIGEKSLFVTTVDFRQVRLYPLSTWKANEILFNAHADVSEGVALVAKTFGGDAEIDAQGRVLLPALLREKMQLEKQPMMVDYFNGRINAVSKKIHDEQLQAAIGNLPVNVATLVKIGFK
jgi:MraZ protein